MTRKPATYQRTITVLSAAYSRERNVHMRRYYWVLIQRLVNPLYVPLSQVYRRFLIH